MEHLRDQLEGHLSSTQEIAERWGINSQTSSLTTQTNSTVPQPVLGPAANVPSLSNLNAGDCWVKLRMPMMENTVRRYPKI